MVQLEKTDDELASSTLELFSELPEVLEMIANLGTAYNKHFEKSYEIFSEIVGRYQEQSHLLDPHLDNIINLLLTPIRDPQIPADMKHAAFKYLYQLSKVRTFKGIIKFLPHEICDFDFVLNLTEQQDVTDSEHWETRYVLLLWLSMLILNPFQMSRLDGLKPTGDNSDNITKTERIFNICKANTNKNDTCAQVASFLASRFLIRIDIKDNYLPMFLNEIIEKTSKDPAQIKCGQLSAIASILKHGKREDLLIHAGILLKWILSTNYKDSSDYLQTKFFIKIIQRLGLIFLKPRLADWRYQRGSRSLKTNLADKDIVELERPDSIINEEKDECIQVPDEIEEVIEELLLSLRSPSSDIRWSGAKGLGRVTNRLPKLLGDEVVGCVIDILNPLEPHEAWHGGCLALAELAKRGLLLANRLEQVVPRLLQALVYDEMKGYMSVGQHIRDAACYMSWAFARAYEPKDLAPFVKKIAAGLIVTTVYDREINCRRAASAAFQESVGRLGNFPNGIDILTEADFFSVGLRNNAYLNISVFVAQFKDYTNPLIDHLIKYKINHWDTAIRELTAKTLFKLTNHNPRYMAQDVLSSLFIKTNSIDVNLRHGSVLAIGEITLALSLLENKEDYLTDSIVVQLNGLILQFLKKDQFKGLSGEIMYQCCCDLIYNCCKANIKVTGECIESWQSIIDACIIRKSSQIREISISALTELCKSYYKTNSTSTNKEFVDNYLRGCQNIVEENIRMGYVSALGALPKFMLSTQTEVVLMMLIKQALVASEQKIFLHTMQVNKPELFMDENSAQTINWSEARRDSIRSITNVISSLGYDDPVLRQHLDKIFECLLSALKEYTTDDRGDIGAWVREASMNALFTLLATCPASYLGPAVVRRIFVGIAQQSVEIIDRTRGLAGSLFCKLVHYNPAIPHIPRHEVLKTIFPEDSSSVLWLYADQTFPLFCAMLSLPDYSEQLIVGLIASIGKLSESLVKYSSSSMFMHLRSHLQEVPRICQEILTVFKNNLQNDRISHPLLNFLDSIMGSGTIDSVLLDDSSDFAEEIYRLVKLELKGQKKLYKLVSSVNVFCQLLQSEKVRSKVLSSLAIYLGLPHVHVRKTTANKLYEAIVIHRDTFEIPEDKIDEILEILSETDWGLPVPEIRPIRNNLCTLLGIKVPVAVTSQ